ncbi:MAG: hypothetical protein H6625_04915 [Bdellovibrionaceae bacterium]|nr:hypothetical protein [Pseudobdellovibrionaceae bacterium]
MKWILFAFLFLLPLAGTQALAEGEGFPAVNQNITHSEARGAEAPFCPSCQACMGEEGNACGNLSTHRIKARAANLAAGKASAPGISNDKDEVN